MNWNASMHPWNRGDRKLQVGRDHFAVTLECINNQVHSARRVGGEPNLVRLRIDEGSNFSPNCFTLREPFIPMNVAVTRHLIVVVSCSLSCLNSQRTSRGGIE